MGRQQRVGVGIAWRCTQLVDGKAPRQPILLMAMGGYHAKQDFRSNYYKLRIERLALKIE